MIKNKKLRWALFFCMAVAQLAVPLSMIYYKEETITKGKVLHFELEAIDPYDPFRGKYIILNPKENKFLLNVNKELKNKSLYATFTQDSLGLAKINNITNTRPEHPYYLKVETYSIFSKGTTKPIIVIYPFDRYYMNEYKAKTAEDLTRELTSDSTQICYAKVAIYKGNASLRSVMVNDKSIEEIINQRSKE